MAEEAGCSANSANSTNSANSSFAGGGSAVSVGGKHPQCLEGHAMVWSTHYSGKDWRCRTKGCTGSQANQGEWRWTCKLCNTSLCMRCRPPPAPASLASEGDACSSTASTYGVEVTESTPLFGSSPGKPQQMHTTSDQIRRSLAAMRGNLSPLLGANKFPCDICLDSVDMAKAVKFPCKHTYCNYCVASYLQSRIVDGRVAPEDLTCPATECNMQIEPTRIPALLRPLGEVEAATVANKYKRFAALRANSDARECPMCGHIQLGHRPKFFEPNNMKCKACHASFCFYHSNAHPGTSCAAYERRVRAQNGGRELGVDAKPCPMCSMPTEKIAGCNHLKCRCGTNWCFRCGTQLLPGIHVCPSSLYDILVAGQGMWILRAISILGMLVASVYCLIGVGMSVATAIATSPIVIPIALLDRQVAWDCLEWLVRFPVMLPWSICLVPLFVLWPIVAFALLVALLPLILLECMVRCRMPSFAELQGPFAGFVNVLGEAAVIALQED